MNVSGLLLIIPTLVIFTFCPLEVLVPSNVYGQTNQESIDLPKIKSMENGSLTDLLYQRRSVRNFSPGEITLDQVSRILFSAQGITRQNRFRTVPSAGALYPLEVYLVTGSVQGLEAGVYAYRPHGHELIQVSSGDRREELAGQCYGQMWVAEAQAVVVICAVYDRVTGKYGQRGERYAHIEAGCAAQNVSLTGYSLGLGSTVVGAFSDKGVAEVVQAAGREEKPLVVMPVGLMSEERD